MANPPSLFELWLAGVRHDQYKGVNPDTLADEWRNWKNFKIVFEGQLGENNNG